MDDKIPIDLPDAFAHGPGVQAELGTAIADFWLEDKNGEPIRELKQIEVKGTQILHPKDRVQITIYGIPQHEVAKCFIGCKALIQFDGYDPIKCFNQDNNGNESTWFPQQEPLNIRHSNQPGEEILFLLFSFPVFYGQQDIIISECYDEANRMGWWRCGQITLQNNNWDIHIKAHQKTKEWNNAIRQTGGLAATHTGRICKVDNTEIEWNEVQNIIKCLHHFLSFSRGHWQPTGYIRLMTSKRECVHEMWGILRGGDYLTHSSMTWWSPHPDAHQLTEVFRGFWALWTDQSWEEVLPEIIYWYLQANLAGRGNLGVDSALVLSQATLEKLSWMYATRAKKAVSEEAFKPGKLRASDQLRLLAALLNLPPDIPDDLDSLKEDATGNKFADSFHAITEIRNQLVHPKKKRQFKPQAEFQAWNLAQWYIEMCLLRIMRFEGKYANRLKLGNWAGETEDVPWANLSSEVGR